MISGRCALKHTKVSPNKVFASISPAARTIDRPVWLSIAVKQPGSQYCCPVSLHGTIHPRANPIPSLSANVVHRLRWASRRESKVHGDSVVLIDLPDWLLLLTTRAPCVAVYAHVSLFLSPVFGSRALHTAVNGRIRHGQTNATVIGIR